jgi:hypothetical protein
VCLFDRPEDAAATDRCTRLNRAIAQVLRLQHAEGWFGADDELRTADIETTYWAGLALETARRGRRLDAPNSKQWQAGRIALARWLPAPLRSEVKLEPSDACALLHLLYFVAETGAAATWQGPLRDDDLRPRIAAHCSAPAARDGSGHATDPLHLFLGAASHYQAAEAETWMRWNRDLPGFATTQRQDGNFAGSWDGVGPRGETGGRVLSTALHVLALQSYYRYTRIVR